MSTIEISRDQWLADRDTGIGASESAAALGVSPFASPFELWCEKTKAIERDDLGGIEAVEFGLRLEPIIAEAFAERTGRMVEIWPQNRIARHEVLPWLICTPDATQLPTDGEVESREKPAKRGDLQIKTTSAWNRKEWSDGPPLHYQVQVQHELAVLGLEWGSLVVLIGGQKLRWFDVRRNQPFIDAMIPALRDFWDRVQNGDPPPPDGSAGTARAIAKLYPGDNGEEIELPPEAADWDRELSEAKVAIKAADELKTAAENKIKAAIGAATLGTLPNGGAYSFKLQSRKGYTVKDTTFRVLRKVE